MLTINDVSLEKRSLSMAGALNNSERIPTFFAKSLRSSFRTRSQTVGQCTLTQAPSFGPTPQFALTMALIVHELATNAAKYGALSRPAGKLSVHWSLADRILNVNWREAGGPPIDSPTHHGFVLRLLHRALAQFSGAVETIFEPDGFICTMKAVLSRK